MTLGRTIRIALAGAGIVVAPWGTVQAVAQPAADQNALVAELRQIREQLAEIERRAMAETPELQARHRALEEKVLAVMVRHDPQTPANLARLEAIPREVEAAEKARDEARLRMLAGEAEGLQRKLNEAQAAAMEEKEIVAEVTAFQADVLKRMKEMEPRTETLLSRARELIQTLQPRS